MEDLEVIVDPPGEVELDKIKVIYAKEDLPKLECILKSGNFSKSYTFSGTHKIMYVNMASYRFKILSYRVSHGTIGLLGKLGYMGGTSDDLTVDDKYHTLSAHGPSKIVIENVEPIRVHGYASLTASDCPYIKFYCDEDYIGSVVTPGQMTNSYIIHPGKHLLTVDSSSACCHSVWLFD